MNKSVFYYAQSQKNKFAETKNKENQKRDNQREVSLKKKAMGRIPKIEKRIKRMAAQGETSCTIGDIPADCLTIVNNYFEEMGFTTGIQQKFGWRAAPGRSRRSNQEQWTVLHIPYISWYKD